MLSNYSKNKKNTYNFVIIIQLLQKLENAIYWQFYQICLSYLIQIANKGR